MLPLAFLLLTGFVHVSADEVPLGGTLEYWFDIPEGEELEYWVEFRGELLKPPVITSVSSHKSLHPVSPGVYTICARLNSSTETANVSVSLRAFTTSSIEQGNQYESSSIKSRRLSEHLLLGICLVVAVGVLWKR